MFISYLLGSKYKENLGMKSLAWPGNISDLNPIKMNLSLFAKKFEKTVCDFKKSGRNNFDDMV